MLQPYYSSFILSSPMSPFRLVLRSLVYHWRTNLAVMLGVAAGTAVLMGALLVGDSMQGSLRDLTLARLGRIDYALSAPRMFRRELADEVAGHAAFQAYFDQAVPAILASGSLENADPDRPARANQVNLVGCDERFWSLGRGGPARPPEDRQIVLNQPVAEELGVGPGDVVLLRLPRLTPIPADSALGRKSETVQTQRLTVAEVIPAEGLGRFGLEPTQQLPRNAYVPLEWLAQRLDQPQRANAILVARNAAASTPAAEEAALVASLHPAMADFGLKIERTPRVYYSVTSDQLLLPPAAEQEILADLAGQTVQPALTYLANTIACGKREISYSTITAVDFATQPPLGPLRTPDGRPIPTLAEGEIVLNSWAADDLQAKPGDTIRVTYFLPESADGQVRPRTESFRLAAVAELKGPAADPDFTPQVTGVTDKLTMGDWDPPFPFDAERIRPNDEEYWIDHRGTPKAFVSLAAGRKLWGSRFGHTTSLRVEPAEGLSVAGLEKTLSLDPAALGFAFQPIKRQGLAASVGATPFNVLFIAFSFFIIAAAVMLVALLFRLGIDARAEQLGILAAVGFRRRRIAGLLVAEGLITSALGSLAGVAGGVGYAALMLAGLRTWWSAAVGTPLVRLHWTWTSIVAGFAAGLIVAVGATAFAVWRAGRTSPRQLLAGQATDPSPRIGTRSPLASWLAVLLVVLALAAGLAALRLDEMAQAGAFFGAGAMVLAALLSLAWSRLRSGSTGPAVAAGRGNLLRMAARNAARNPGRSTLSAGLIASVSFLIVAISAFRLDPTGQTPHLESGNGGFALVAQCTQPIYQDLNSPEGRLAIGGLSDEDLRRLADTTIYALRVKPGEDASCLNLYQPRQPRVLGVPHGMVRRGGFAWSGSLARSDQERENPWLLLEDDPGADADGTPLVPVVLDVNTAQYALHKGLGQTLDIQDGRGGSLRLAIVGLLANSILQGDVLMGERELLGHFPEISGFRFFLIETPPDSADAVKGVLQRVLGDYGFAAESSGQRLAGFLTVQNTYLSTFQSLGGLGLLLGTLGLAAVQLRGVLERRRELALLRAAGLRRGLLACMVTLENALLLVTGLGCGILAALVAVLPHLLGGRAMIPWSSLAAILGLVLAVGLLAGLAAVRATLRAPLLAALRGE